MLAMKAAARRNRLASLPDSPWGATPRQSAPPQAMLGALEAVPTAQQVGRLLVLSSQTAIGHTVPTRLMSHDG